MSKYLTPAQQEIRSALNEAELISKQPEVSKRDEARLSVLLAKVKALQNGAPTGDATAQWFRDFFNGREMRSPMQEGTQTISYTQGQEGGYLVPQEFNDQLVVGMAAVDPMLNPDVCTVLPSKDGSLRPINIPGVDMSTFKAVKVAEGSQQTGQTPPVLSGKILNGWKYKASLPLTTELEDDSAIIAQSFIQRVFTTAFARGIGIDLINGNGSTAPQGVLTGAANSTFTTANSGKIVSPDISSIYFSVNAFYRSQPKCAWLMNDAVYHLVRDAADNSGRPLLTFENDQQTLMGKPVYISPTLLGAGNNGIVFGDLSSYVVRVSRMIITRNTQASGYVDKGQALYTGIMRADAAVIDPTGGTTPPIVYAGVHA